MRASRLLQILLILQNRGRQTAPALAAELEVSPRTILRDVDAMTEAGLPVLTLPGHRGGIELGFNYRTRLTGLARDEAEALGVLLGADLPALAALGLAEAARRARSKLLESLPDSSRGIALDARARFPLHFGGPVEDDPRLAALAEAVRQARRVRLRARSRAPQVVHPVGLGWDGTDWSLTDALTPGAPIPRRDWGDINISRLGFTGEAS